MDTAVMTGQQAPTSSAVEDYLFDLQGFFVIEQAVEADLVEDLNRALDEVPADLEPNGWWGNVQRAGTADPGKGLELQNVVEAGEPFERLIDHPSWLSHMRRYCGEEDSYVCGLFIDECFASIRRQGGYLRVHSGGYRKALRGMYHYDHGVFRCAQVNVLVALTDIGPGDGGTLVIPGSHKSNLPHPQAEQFAAGVMDGMIGTIQPRLRRGDAFVFCDALAHGAASRTNAEGERRTVIYRYGPSWGSTRAGYVYSDELLARLTPERREILQPIAPRRPPR
ncbi:MAG TPA: phytanoyl-CoA dioxygenase family protein [Acidimicrobiales bacterium]|nr:phytanoyl-CoA dioxygenase family protein [Acidimicrobiales bacterium]